MARRDVKRTMYESWVRGYAADLYRFARRLCGREDVAEELVQETFYQAWRSIGSLREPGSARRWLLKILRHRWAHWVRHETHRLKPAGDAENQHAVSEQDAPGEALARRESLQAALDALDEHYKLPLLLVFLEGFTCQQAAELLEIPLGTVLSRIYRARQFLRGRLEGQEDRSIQQTLKLHREDEERDRRSGLGGRP